ncbi:uncharacterized protein LOC118199729 [Stegodyphus dumicola]|uniref:uncharacterized protein LOC118199729 n=1 Tax=Stegodyphus dumicola TaxID=202533 RepID=UPI0015A8C3F0|nr:uncharacterized protein LOC118199729 [Stegodyphus dumicola]
MGESRAMVWFGKVIKYLDEFSIEQDVEFSTEAKCPCQSTIKDVREIKNIKNLRTLENAVSATTSSRMRHKKLLPSASLNNLRPSTKASSKKCRCLRKQCPQQRGYALCAPNGYNLRKDCLGYCLYSSKSKSIADFYPYERRNYENASAYKGSSIITMAKGISRTPHTLARSKLLNFEKETDQDLTKRALSFSPSKVRRSAFCKVTTTEIQAQIKNCAFMEIIKNLVPVVTPNLVVSKEMRTQAADIIRAVFEVIANTAGKLASSRKSKTLTTNDVKTAIELLLPKQRGKLAMRNATIIMNKMKQTAKSVNSALISKASN